MAVFNSCRPYDVAIVGSGPAGSIAALYLASHGARVAVLEKKSLPRYKTCGGGIVQRAMRFMPVGVAGVFEREFYSVELNLGSAHLCFSVKREEPIISMAMRDKLDFFLVSSAKKAGAEIHPECRVSDIIIRNDQVELITEKGSVYARFVVAADGAISVVARKAGWRETRRLVPAIEYEVSVADEVLKRFSHTARFDFGLVPSGYAWSFPKKDHISIGAMCMESIPIKWNSLLDKYLKLIGLDKIRHIKKHASIIPVSPRKDTFVRRKVLLTGDAAGFADPITGEGISLALRSGLMAGKALIDFAFEESSVKYIYESEVERHILPELRLGRILSRIVFNYPKTRDNLFRLFGQKLTEAITDVIMGKKTYGELLHNPMNYLRLFRP